jgi:hypothetical protein
VSSPAPEIQSPDQKTGPARGRSGAAFGEASWKNPPGCVSQAIQGSLPKTGGAPCVGAQPATGRSQNSSQISLTISSWSSSPWRLADLECELSPSLAAGDACRLL